MKIEYNCKNKIEIGNVKIGQVFLCEGIPYIRVDKGYVDVIIKTSYPYLVLNMKENKLSAFSTDVVVEPVDAKIIIE